MAYLRTPILLVALVTLSSIVTSSKLNKNINDLEAYESEEVLFNENKPCPRDCICTVSQGYRFATCNRLELSSQKFSNDITDLIVENAQFPLTLDDNIFKTLGLHQVTTIKIANSTIEKISASAFHGLDDLYSVNFYNCKIQKKLHPNTFAKNKKLLLLTLENSKLKMPEKESDEVFLNSADIQELDLSYCNMDYLSKKVFSAMPGLMYLNLAGNRLSELNVDTFKNLLDLEELDLSDNNITTFPEGIFSTNTELVTLHIQKNPIESLYGLQIPDLLRLNAGETKLNVIGPSTFNGMVQVANLNLSGNGIEEIHSDAFSKLVEMNYLDLSHNDLDFVSSDLIKENIELEIFKISYNPNLITLPTNGFTCSADQFDIYLFDVSNCRLEDLSDNTLSTFTALTQINLSNNELKQISENLFAKCNRLVDINLANNLITRIETKAFAQNHDLIKLNLHGNPLKVLATEIFAYIPKLTWLDISESRLNAIFEGEHPQSMLKNLHYLNIASNKIKSVTQSELEMFENLDTMGLDNNPFECNADFENLMVWLTKKKVSPTEKETAIETKIEVDPKKDETTYSWQFLSQQICKTDLNDIVYDPIPPTTTDEETWEKIKKEDNFGNDLKSMLEKVSDVNKSVAMKDEDNVEDDIDEDDDGDDEAYNDDDEDLDVTVKLQDNKVKIDSHIVHKVEVLDDTNPSASPNIFFRDDDAKEDDGEEDNLDVDVNLLFSEDEYVNRRYNYLWPILIIFIGALILLLLIGKIVMLVCQRRSRQSRYNSAIIAAMNNQSKTKKDCGLVYQQLSEDLKGPATPKLSRYTPLKNISVLSSYETTPINQKDVVAPEAV